MGPTGINDRGLITSGVMLNSGYTPAIYDSRRGQITTLGSLGGVTSFGFSGVATAINDLGQAAGYSYLDAVNFHAFIYSNGVMTDIGSFGGYSAALDINNCGHVVGSSSDSASGVAHAFSTAMESMTEINLFGAPEQRKLWRRESTPPRTVVGGG